MATIQTSIKLNDHFSSALSSLNKALNSAINSFETVNKVSGNAINTDSIQKARSELAKSNLALQNIESSINDSNTAQQRFNNTMREGTSNAQSLWDKIKGIAAAYLTFQGAKSIVGAGDAYIGNVARIDLMNDGLQTTAELQQKIYESSQRALTGYGAMSDVVAKLGITAKHAFKNNDEMIAFAELIQKQFTIAGTGTQAKNAAMYQLTQAMASGRLQGDEFRSILENAPMLAQTIADHMGMTLGQLREASSEGKITADIIKNALFSAADETNKKFSNMPMTWADLWVQATNKVNKGLEPLYKKLQSIWNSKKFQKFLNILVNGFLTIMNVGVMAFDAIVSVVSVLYDNWSLFEPIVWGLVAALGVYFAMQTAGLVKSAIQWAVATWAAISYQWALFRMAVAQYGFNTALAMCPLTWFLYAVVAIIAAFYLLIAIINKVAGTSISATGIIAGVFSTLGAFLWNLFLAFGELVIGIFQHLVNPIIEFVNFFANVWTAPISSVINLFTGLADTVLAILQKIASAMDFVFGSNMASTVGGWRKGLRSMADEAVKEYAPNEDYKKVMSTLDYSMSDMPWAKRIEYGGAFDKGYDAGSNFSLTDTMKDALGFSDEFKNGLTGDNGKLGDIGTAMKNANMPMLDKLDAIANNTGATNATLSKNNEDMSYLRELAERDAINQISNKTVKVDMTNNNNVSSNYDVDEMVNHLQEKIYNTMITSAEGTHI